MSPALEVGDIVIAQGVPASEIRINDTIIFESPQGSLTIHRVITTQTMPNGTIQFKTKGDANSAEDAYWVTEQDIRGKAIYRIPYIGWLALEPTIPLIIITASIIVILLWPEKKRRKT